MKSGLLRLQGVRRVRFHRIIRVPTRFESTKPDGRPADNLQSQNITTKLTENVPPEEVVATESENKGQIFQLLWGVLLSTCFLKIIAKLTNLEDLSMVKDISSSMLGDERDMVFKIQ